MRHRRHHSAAAQPQASRKGVRRGQGWGRREEGVCRANMAGAGTRSGVPPPSSGAAGDKDRAAGWGIGRGGDMHALLLASSSGGLLPWDRAWGRG